MFCFTNILNIFFSFVTCAMHKNPHQNAGNGIKETLFFKILGLGSMPPDRPRRSRAFGASRANSYLPPPKKISKPVRLCKPRLIFARINAWPYFVSLFTRNQVLTTRWSTWGMKKIPRSLSTILYSH